MKWYVMVWKRYAEFSGRSRRKEYWMFVLIQTLISMGIYLVGLGLIVARLVRHEPPVRLYVLVGVACMLLFSLLELAAMIPSLAVSVRRLHDIGKSGWWLLIGLIPLVGAIILLIDHATDSQPGDNQYGPNPKVPAPAVLAGYSSGNFKL